MKLLRSLIVLSALALQGCSTLSALWAGDYEERLAKTEGGAIAVNPLTRQPIKLRVRQSKSAALSGDAADAVKALAELEIEHLKLERIKVESGQQGYSCQTLTPGQVAELSASGQSQYFQTQNSCQMMQFIGQTTQALSDALSKALQPRSAVESVANSFMGAVANVEREGTNKLRAIVNPLAISIGVRERERTARNGQDAFAGAVADAAAVGNTTTGDIYVGDNLAGSADSNDGGLASSNDGGGSSAGFGEDGLPVAGTGGNGSGVAGDGSGTSNNTSGGNTNIFTLGNSNNVGFSQYSGRTFVETRGTQQLEPSANGGVNDESNVDQQPIIDSNTDSDLSNDPENGSNNSLF